MMLTKLVIVLTIIILVLYDIFAFVKWGPPATLSFVVYDASLKLPIIPFAAGLLCGHLFASLIK